MPRLISALAAGVLFGLGLTVSHMIDPAKVLGFLDIAGDWDPSLACVMLGELIVVTPTYVLQDASMHRSARRRSHRRPPRGSIGG
jgi:uncharacterized membrane protein YedE/YeeE